MNSSICMANKKKKYSVTELMSDERFQNYCLQKNKADEEFWKTIILQNWNQRSVFEEAYNAVHTLTNHTIYNEPRQGKVINIKQSPKESNFSKLPWLVSGIAAAFLLLFLGSLSSDDPTYIQVTANVGETKEIILPDSSHVILNSNSILVYEQSMLASREVELVGEGYFKVKTKNDLTPFLVKTQHGNIQVTGTTFNVRARSKSFESTLIEGGITFKREGKNDVILQPGDHLKISDNSLQITSEEVHSKVAWTDGRLYFKQASIKQIVKRIKDEFDLNIIVDNKQLQSKKINANIRTSDPMDLLKSIAAIYDFTVVQETTDKVILK